MRRHPGDVLRVLVGGLVVMAGALAARHSRADGGGGVDGWSNASETFNVTLELVRRGYTEAQIAKMWSGNLLRVMAEVERVAAQLQRSRT